jgi:hypothetical protein
VYAITSTYYRAVNNGDPLMPGETAVDVVPQTLIDLTRAAEYNVRPVVTFPSSTIANLPTASSSTGRSFQVVDSSGNSTGETVYSNGSQWLRTSDNSPVN